MILGLDQCSSSAFTQWRALDTRAGRGRQPFEGRNEFGAAVRVAR